MVNGSHKGENLRKEYKFIWNLHIHIFERRGSWNKESFETAALWHMIEAVMVQTANCTCALVVVD